MMVIKIALFRRFVAGSAVRQGPNGLPAEHFFGYLAMLVSDIGNFRNAKGRCALQAFHDLG